jgi:GNAT superfamily N-acetyltransferase
MRDYGAMAKRPDRGPLLIRRYQQGDHEEVWSLHHVALEQTGAHAGPGPWDDDLHQVERVYLADGGEFLVGVLDGRIVAMGALRRKSAECAELKRMRVHPDVQRRGFGQRILTELEGRARALGYAKLVLDTTSLQTPAQKLYEKNGFRETHRATEGRFEVLYFEKVLEAPPA